MTVCVVHMDEEWYHVIITLMFGLSRDTAIHRQDLAIDIRVPR